MLHWSSLSPPAFEDTENFSHTLNKSLCFVHQVLKSNLRMSTQIEQSKWFMKNFPESILKVVIVPADNVY